MKRLAYTLLVCLSMLALPASATSEDLQPAAKAFFQALDAKDSRAVVAAHAKAARRDDEKFQLRAQRFVEQWSKRPLKAEVLAVQKVEEDLGVIAIQDRPGDLDPIFMTKEAGDWKILSVGDYHPNELQLEPSALSRLDGLKAWFKQEKRAIKAKAAQK